MQIRFTDGGRGLASIKSGKRGGEVILLRRGFPVAAEVVGAFPLGHGHDVARTLALLGVADASDVARGVVA